MQRDYELVVEGSVEAMAEESAEAVAEEEVEEEEEEGEEEKEDVTEVWNEVADVATVPYDTGKRVSCVITVYDSIKYIYKYKHN